MKITRRQLRRLISEAKFVSKRPLDRDAMQIALGIHPEQIGRNETEIELKSHPYYEEGKKDLFNFIEVNADNHNWDPVAHPGEHIDTIVANATDFLEALFSNYNRFSRFGAETDGITEQHVELMLGDLLNSGYVTVNIDDIVLTTPEGDDWYFST
jgi:hypothetical protein